MTEDEKRCLIAALRAVEALCFRSMALETILEKFNVRNWKALADKLAAEPTVTFIFEKGFANYSKILSANLQINWRRSVFKNSC